MAMSNEQRRPTCTRWHCFHFDCISHCAFCVCFPKYWNPIDDGLHVFVSPGKWRVFVLFACNLIILFCKIAIIRVLFTMGRPHARVCVCVCLCVEFMMANWCAGAFNNVSDRIISFTDFELLQIECCIAIITNLSFLIRGEGAGAEGHIVSESLRGEVIGYIRNRIHS